MREKHTVESNKSDLTNTGKEDVKYKKANILMPLLISITTNYLLLTTNFTNWIWVIVLTIDVISSLWLFAEVIYSASIYVERLASINVGEEYKLYASEVNVMLKSDGQKPLTKSELKDYRDGMFY